MRTVTYRLTFFGKKKEVSTRVFWWYICTFYTAYLVSMIGGVWRFGEDYFQSGWYALIPAVVIFGSLNINDIHYGALPDNKLANFVKGVFAWSAVAYFIYTIYNTHFQ